MTTHLTAALLQWTKKDSAKSPVRAEALREKKTTRRTLLTTVKKPAAQAKKVASIATAEAETPTAKLKAKSLKGPTQPGALFMILHLKRALGASIYLVFDCA